MAPSMATTSPLIRCALSSACAATHAAAMVAAQTFNQMRSMQSS
jgi:hypothetical protein